MNTMIWYLHIISLWTKAVCWLTGKHLSLRAGNIILLGYCQGTRFWGSVKSVSSYHLYFSKVKYVMLISYLRCNVCFLLSVLSRKIRQSWFTNGNFLGLGVLLTFMEQCDMPVYVKLTISICTNGKKCCLQNFCSEITKLNEGNPGKYQWEEKPMWQ